MSDIFSQVKEVVVEVMKLDETSAADIKEETRFVEDLNADSMDQFFLIDGFCEKFDVEISDEDAREIRTVGDVVKQLQK